MKRNNNRPLDTSVNILSSILTEGKSVNCLIKETSSDRVHVIKIINKLHELGLLSKQKADRGKRKLVTSTSIGRQLASLIMNIESHKRTILNLLENTLTYYDAGKIRKSKKYNLIKLGWSSMEIESYDKILKNLIKILKISEENFIQFVTSRFLLFSEDLDFANLFNNELIKNLLNRILLGIFMFHVSFLRDYRQFFVHDSKSSDALTRTLSVFHQESQILYKNALTEFNKNSLEIPTSLSATLKENMIAQLRIVDPPRRLINRQVRILSKKVENSQGKTDISIQVRHLLLNIYKNYKV